MSHTAHADGPARPPAPSLPSDSMPARATAQLYADLRFTVMGMVDLPEVEAIERDVYEHPWTMGNFVDSLASGYQTRVVRDAAGGVIGYFLLLLAPDDAHLLNITVRHACQGRGIGRVLLNQACSIARSHAASAMLLEVRPSNPQALRVYRHVGFQEIGLRKGYYPGAHQQREDAIVMRLDL